MTRAVRTRHARRGLLLAALLALLAPAVSQTPASAAVIAKKCTGIFSDTANGSGRVCVQYDGAHVNGVLDWVVGSRSVRLDVGLWQCRGINLDCPTNPNVSATNLHPAGHVFLPTPLVNASGGHYYQACGGSELAGFCTPFLAVPL
jgi:hypothetical protein